MNMHSNSLLQQGLHHVEPSASTQLNPEPPEASNKVCHGLWNGKTPSGKRCSASLTRHLKSQSCSMTSSQRKMRAPATLIIYTHISWLPQPSHDFFQASMKDEFPSTQKRISAKSNMKVTALVFLPGTWRSKWLWLKVLCTKETRNIKYWWYWRYWKHPFWKHPSWGSMLLIHRQIHLTTDALTRPKVNKITAMLPNQTNLGASQQDGTCKGEWFI